MFHKHMYLYGVADTFAKMRRQYMKRQRNKVDAILNKNLCVSIVEMAMITLFVIDRF